MFLARLPGLHFAKFNDKELITFGAKEKSRSIT
jgi:hypothetical protein